MKLRSGTHLSYCTNIHPAESWQKLREQLGEHVPLLAERLSRDVPFGLGLRLSDQASRELQAEGAFGELLDLLAATNCYVFTLNGFPFGQFHQGAVKERVYLPDWTCSERVDYTLRLAQLLVRLAPAQANFAGTSAPDFFSISTVPGGFRQGQGPAGRELMVDHFVRVAASLHRERMQTGVTVGLALEPEPACLLETTEECVRFLTDEVFACAHDQGRRSAGFGPVGLSGISGAEAEEILRRHLGVCLDTCHAAVQFEDPRETMGLLRASGVGVFKIQATAGLRLVRPTSAQLDRLRTFDDGVYLHQSSMLSKGSVTRFVDLGEAIAQFENGRAEPEEWRVHFHVPVFQRALKEFTSTQEELAVFLEEQRRAPVTTHIEVETYTFDVLPAEFKTGDVTEAIAREIQWTRRQLEDASSC